MYNAVQAGNTLDHNCKKFICDTKDEMDEIDVSKLAAGSTALVIETGERYILSNRKEWKLLLPYSGGGGIGGDFLSADDIASAEETKDFLSI